MSPLGLQRLEKLLDFAEKTPGHAVFDFSKFHCGTVGCLAGEAPYCWPQDWEFPDSRSFPALTGSRSQPVESDLAIWFGANLNEIDHLFFPSDGAHTRQQPARFGGKLLSRRATKAEVIANARIFIELQRGGQ